MESMVKRKKRENLSEKYKEAHFFSSLPMYVPAYDTYARNCYPILDKTRALIKLIFYTTFWLMTLTELINNPYNHRELVSTVAVDSLYYILVRKFTAYNIEGFAFEYLLDHSHEHSVFCDSIYDPERLNNIQCSIVHEKRYQCYANSADQLSVLECNEHFVKTTTIIRNIVFYVYFDVSMLSVRLSDGLLTKYVLLGLIDRATSRTLSKFSTF